MAVQGKKKRTKSPAKKNKAGFTPPELRFRTRFLGSLAGKIVTGILGTALLLLLNTLAAGRNLDLFFLLTGIEGLLAMIGFWLLLLFRRAARP